MSDTASGICHSRTAGAGRIDLKVEDDVEYRVGTKVSIGSGSILASDLFACNIYAVFHSDHNQLT